MFCSNCKSEIPDEANFCPYCSTRVEAPQVVIPKEIQVEPIQFKKKKNNNRYTGFETARKILDTNGLKDIMILETNGNLSDHYDPKRKVIK